MTPIERKSLKHCIRLLESVDSYPIHRSLADAMIKEGIAEDVRERIVGIVRKAVLDETSKAHEAKEWVQALLIDDVE